MNDPMDIDGREDLMQDYNQGTKLFVDVLQSYYPINYTTLHQYYQSLKPLLAKIDSFNVKYNWDRLFDRQPVNDHTLTLLLILPYDIIVDGEKTVAYDHEVVFTMFSEHLKGYALVKTYNLAADKVIYGIFNFCKDPTLKKSNGKMLFSAVHNYLTNLKKPDGADHYYWLQIDYLGVKRKLTPLLIATYASFGFSTPYISEYLPDGTNTGKAYLCLFKKAGEPIATKSEVVQICRQSHYLMYNSGPKHPPKYSMFPITLMLEKDLQMFLNSLIYCKLDTKLFTRNHNFNYEICGNMSYERIMKLDTPVMRHPHTPFAPPSPAPQDHYVLNMVVKDHGNKLKDMEISYHNCDIDVTNSYMFHTHPLSWYITTGVLLATPSQNDISFFIREHINGRIRSICQFVVTLEGIYTISLNRPINNARQYNNIHSYNSALITGENLFAMYVTKIFEYPYDKRRFNWLGEGISQKIPQANQQIGSHLKQYFDHIAEQKNSDRTFLSQHYPWLMNIIDAIDIQLYTWDELKTTPRLTIYSPKMGSNSCLDYEEFKYVTDVIPHV